MNNRAVSNWFKDLKMKLNHFNWVGARNKLARNGGIAPRIAQMSPSLKVFLNKLHDDLVAGRLNPYTMSPAAVNAAVKVADYEYAYRKAQEAQFAAQQAARYQAYLNTWRKQVAAAAAAAERASQQAAANAQRNRNAAAQRNAQRAKAEANAARRAAKSAENEARASAAEKARLNETRRKANEALLSARRAAQAAQRKAKEEENAKKSGPKGPSAYNEREREKKNMENRKNRWKLEFNTVKARYGGSTRRTIKNLARRHLGINLNIPNNGPISKHIKKNVHPNRETSNLNKRALRTVLFSEL